MIPREMMLKVLGAMPDAQIMQALAAVQGQQIPGGMDMELGAQPPAMGEHVGLTDPVMKGLSYDADKDGVQGWSKVKIQRGQDDRPELADKKFMIPKQGLGQLGAPPQGDGSDPYGAPGGM
jgi:hypothetical protein